MGNKKGGILIKKESGSLAFTGLKILRDEKSTASECIMVQYKKKGTYDYKLLK